MRKEQIEYYEDMEQKELEHQEDVRGVHDEPTDSITPKHLNYLKCVLISQLLLEANDELKGSVGFKQNVTASIDELVMIEALVKQYKENKDEINKTQITEFTKLD